jgi:quercetin dioxygenase-like cupin family protein
MKSSRILVSTVWVGIVMAASASGDTPKPSFKRTELQRHDTSVPTREAIMTRGEFGAGAILPRHTHVGEEMGYILEGEVILEVEGKPAVTLKAGDVFFVPSGVVHGGKASTKGPVKVVASYFVEKGKPLTTEVK